MASAPETSPVSATPSRRSTRRSTKKWTTLKIIATIAIVAIVVAGSYTGYLYMKFNQMLDDVSSGTDVPDTTDDNGDPIVVSPHEQAQTLLLLGVDYRKETGSMNTDVIMVITLNPNDKSAVAVSIPRDTKITSEISGLAPEKANWFYSHYLYHDRIVDEEGADKNIKALFGKYLDVPIDYVSVFNFRAFSEIIDLLGGLTLDVDMNMCYVDNADGTNINLSKGRQKLDGKNALDFVRYRKSNEVEGCNTAESGDLERNKRQDQVISAVIDKMKTIGGVLKIGAIFDAVSDNLHTDIPPKHLRKFIETYFGINKNHVTFFPMVGDWKTPFIYISDEQLETAKQLLRDQLEKRD